VLLGLAKGRRLAGSACPPPPLWCCACYCPSQLAPTTGRLPRACTRAHVVCWWGPTAPIFAHAARWAPQHWLTSAGRPPAGSNTMAGPTKSQRWATHSKFPPTHGAHREAVFLCFCHEQWILVLQWHTRINSWLRLLLLVGIGSGLLS